MKNVSKKYSFPKVWSLYHDLLDEASEWWSEYRQISDFLIPGRGIYNTYSKPPKRKLSSPKVVNGVAEDALYVLTSGMHGGLTSPSMKWFDRRWLNPAIQDNEMLRSWLQQTVDICHDSLHASNFYSVINSFYTELCGFGTGVVYVGEDTYQDFIPFRFEILTAGEYLFSTGIDGRIETFARVLFMSPAQVVEKFEQPPKALKRIVKENQEGAYKVTETVLEIVVKEEYSSDKPYTQIYYLLSSAGTPANTNTPVESDQKPLLVRGFYEMPYIGARWNTIGSDVYGVGPGSRALPHIKRLQEMEKSLLMANHKQLDPPVNAPARMRNKLNTLPGGRNYYANPQEVVTSLYNVNIDVRGTLESVARTEQALQRIFFNDIFLTAARDPNASPYKATEVNAREQEKMLRLGPVIERLQHEFFMPLLDRCFNILRRKDMLPELSDDLKELAGNYETVMVSPMAAAQKMIAMNGLQTFLGMIGQMAQFKQDVIDNVDADAAARLVGEISGVEYGVMRMQDEVERIRRERAAVMAKERQAQAETQQAELGAGVGLQQAQAQKTQAEAGAILTESQAQALEAGIM